MKILAGTSGFAFKEWKGPFYPKTLPDDAMLGFYASRFPVVEINNTFYRLPRENVLRDWASKVPGKFRFAIKASQKITHFARLKPEAMDAVKYLVKTTSALGERLGPILFQLPPNMKKDMPRLHEFLESLPDGPRYAMEFRHESWFGDDLMQELRDHDVALVAIDQEDFSAPLQLTASWAYLRLHKLNYDANALSEWATKVRDLGCDEAYVFFKHDHVPESAGSGPLAVEAFSRACAA